MMSFLHETETFIGSSFITLFRRDPLTAARSEKKIEENYLTTKWKFNLR